MLVPSTSNERSTVNTSGHLPPHMDTSNPNLGRQGDYHTATATAAAAMNASYVGGPHPDDANQFHPHQHSYNQASAAAAAAAAAAQLQHQQQQLQQQHLQQQHLQQQHLHQLQQSQLQQSQMQQSQLHHHHHQQHVQQLGQGPPPDFGAGILHSKYMENEIIKTFSSKQDLVKYVKSVLNDEEQCKIVINSSKPKAVYFQCERSGLFRTTVKDATKRQRVAYTKRSKCGYRLVANLYPPEKDKKKFKKGNSPDDNGLDRNLDEKLNEFQQHSNSMGHDSPMLVSNEMWILRMINPAHNHPPEPPTGKKKRLKYSRTLVEKPLNRSSGGNDFSPNDMVSQIPHHSHHQLAQAAHHVQVPHLHQHQHHDDSHHTPSVQDVAVIAAIEATPATAAAVALHSQNPPVDPNIDPNVDPSVQDHDHSHGNLR